jgi:hypothetical protein
LTRAQRLSSASTSVQGALAVLVRSTMSRTARWYSRQRFRLRQSSGVILNRLKRDFSRARNRRSCSSGEIASQNFTMTAPARTSSSSNWLISA